MERQKFLKQRLVFHLTKELKQRIDYLQWRAKKLLKQRLDFHLRKEFKQRIDSLQSKAKTLLRQRLDFPLEKRIETANRLLIIERQKFGETTVRFSI